MTTRTAQAAKVFVDIMIDLVEEGGFDVSIDYSAGGEPTLRVAGQASIVFDEKEQAYATYRLDLNGAHSKYPANADMDTLYSSLFD
jgi:hypothetical protein